MSSFDIKIGEENKSNNQNKIDYDNFKLQQELQYLNQQIREAEYKRREQHRATNNLLMWILILMIIYIIPDIIIKIANFFILTEIL